jgi:hypothetical protein
MKPETVWLAIETPSLGHFEEVPFELMPNGKYRQADGAYGIYDEINGDDRYETLEPIITTIVNSNNIGDTGKFKFARRIRRYSLHRNTSLHAAYNVTYDETDA